ncbi:hypothetical protein GCM10028777_28070 [Angustibacter speluncae]
MTAAATGSRPAPADPTTARVLARAAAAEWTRTWTVRSSWVFLVTTALVVLVVSTVGATDLREGPRPDGITAWDVGRLGGALAVFPLVALALVLATADHARGAIVPTLQWTPRRGLLLAARAGTVTATVALVGTALVAVGAQVGVVVVPDLALPLGAGAEGLGTVAYVYGSLALLAVGLGLATRSTPGGLSLLFALLFVVPVLLPEIVRTTWAADVARAMPGTGALDLLFQRGAETAAAAGTDGESFLVLGCWAVGALVLGGVRLLRSDAG